MQYWIVVALLLAVHVFFGLRWGFRVKDKQQSYSAFDWVMLLLFWWFFWMVSTPTPFYRMLAVLSAGAAAIGILVWASPARSDDAVDAILITGLDVSSSINAQETMLQIEGVAAAIKSPAVVSAIEQGRRGRIGFQIFVWADGTYPVLLDWTAIDGQEAADAASAEILSKLQGLIDASSRNVGTLTNLSAAMDHAGKLLNTAPWLADRALVNMVGNGEDNVGEDPKAVRDALVAAGATVNGVVVGGDQAIMTYYRANVIGGKHSFVLPAANADDMANAMIMKFVTEIASNGLSRKADKES